MSWQTSSHQSRLRALTLAFRVKSLSSSTITLGGATGAFQHRERLRRQCTSLAKRVTLHRRSLSSTVLIRSTPRVRIGAPCGTTHRIATVAVLTLCSSCFPAGVTSAECAPHGTFIIESRVIEVVSTWVRRTVWVVTCVQLGSIDTVPGHLGSASHST